MYFKSHFSYFRIDLAIFDASWHDFSAIFCKFYENVLFAFGGKHIFEERFLPISYARRCFRTQRGFKTATFGGPFPLCAVQKLVCFADWAENGPLWKLCLRLLVFLHAFSTRFSYFRSWFCHCSWEALLTVTSIPACTLIPFSIFPLLVLSPLLRNCV